MTTIILSIIAIAVFSYLLQAFVKLALLYRRDIQSYKNFWQQRISNGPDKNDFILVVLGDSTAQAIGASAPLEGIAGRSAAYIEHKTGRPVFIANFSKTGARLRDVVNDQLPQMKQQPDAVLVAIGANDVTAQTNPKEFAKDLDRLFARLPVERTIFTDVPAVRGREPYNNTLLKIAKSSNVPVAATWQTFEPLDWQTGMYAADWYHPSSKGYAVWFDVIKPKLSDIL